MSTPLSKLRSYISAKRCQTDDELQSFLLYNLAHAIRGAEIQATSNPNDPILRMKIIQREINRREKAREHQRTDAQKDGNTEHENKRKADAVDDCAAYQEESQAA